MSKNVFLNRLRSLLPLGSIVLALLLFIASLSITWIPVLAQGKGTPTPADGSSTDGESSDVLHSLIGRSNCLICHSDGFGGADVIPDDHATYTNEECLDCHKPAASDSAAGGHIPDPGVIPTPIAHPAAEDRDACFECHALLEDGHAEIAQAWEESVHGQAGVSCSDCHGGDPRTDEMNLSMNPDVGFIGIPIRGAIPAICGGCHSDVERMRQYNLPTDQYAKYIESVHGKKLLQEGDTRVAICTDCHSTHDIKKARDPTAAVYPLNVPEMCAGCHSDASYMEPYDIPTDQLDVYKESAHGQALLNDQDIRAPNCASCHGSHAAKPPEDDEVVNVCGKCHTATQGYYEESLHSRIGDAAPRCWTCHGTHDIGQPDESLFIHPEPPDWNCGTCHVDEESFRMDRSRFASKEDRRCDTCHHEGSMIMTQVVALRSALVSATEAYENAAETIQQAASRGMIVEEAENKLAEARTSLISARATLHTTKLPVVNDLAEDAITAAETAREMAAARLHENIFRRRAMGVAIGAITINIITLYGYKRRLHKQLEGEEPDTG